MNSQNKLFELMFSLETPVYPKDVLREKFPALYDFDLFNKTSVEDLQKMMKERHELCFGIAK